MSNKAKPTQRVQPKLRFPEFQDAGDWIKTDLHKIAKPVLEKAVGDVLEAALTLSGEHGLIAQGEYFGKKIAGENTDRYIKIIQDDFVYNDRTTKLSTYGTIKRLSKHKGGVVSPIYKCFRFNKDEYPLFWEWYFESGTHESQLRSLINEGARAGRFNISIQKFLSASAWRPKAEEQQKIADCLSSLDELIEAEDQKLDTLQRHKKGLMQKLFPAEGETLPKRRFPEFQNGEAWDVKPLGEICDILNNRRQPISSNNREKGEYPYYGASGIVDYVNDYIFDERLLLVGEDGAKWGANERSAFIAEGKYWVNNHAHVLKPRKINDVLLESFLVMLDMSPHITGAAPPKLTLGKLKNIPIPLPQNQEEQQKIADCLSSLDELIEAEGQKLASLQRHKKGLMQKLFPTVSEVQE